MGFIERDITWNVKFIFNIIKTFVRHIVHEKEIGSEAKMHFVTIVGMKIELAFTSKDFKKRIVKIFLMGHKLGRLII